MQFVHELGHVLAAWVTGGEVTAVVLHPLSISRTDVAPNPHPLIVVWGGPVFGSLVPLTCWVVAAYRRASAAYLWRFFAGFCLVANGVYLGYAVIEPIGDASELLRHGARLWHLETFAIVTVVSGLVLWHGQGRHFSIGKEGRAVSLKHAVALWGLLLLVVVGEVFWTQVTGFR